MICACNVFRHYLHLDQSQASIKYDFSGVLRHSLLEARSDLNQALSPQRPPSKDLLIPIVALLMNIMNGE